jgi:hypothetical protein
MLNLKRRLRIDSPFYSCSKKLILFKFADLHVNLGILDLFLIYTGINIFHETNAHNLIKMYWPSDQ